MAGLFDTLRTAVEQGLDPTNLRKQFGQTLQDASKAIEQVAAQAGETVVKAEFPLVFDYVPPEELAQEVESWQDHDTEVRYLSENTFKITEKGKSMRLGIRKHGNGCLVTADGDAGLMFAVANLLESAAYQIKTANVRKAAYAELYRRDAQKAAQEAEECPSCGTSRSSNDKTCSGCGYRFS